eukprot:jgi/Mesvir1/25953/Mv20945-RA.1
MPKGVVHRLPPPPPGPPPSQDAKVQEVVAAMVAELRRVNGPILMKDLMVVPQVQRLSCNNHVKLKPLFQRKEFYVNGGYVSLVPGFIADSYPVDVRTAAPSANGVSEVPNSRPGPVLPNSSAKGPAAMPKNKSNNKKPAFEVVPVEMREVTNLRDQFERMHASQAQTSAAHDAALRERGGLGILEAFTLPHNEIFMAEDTARAAASKDAMLLDETHVQEHRQWGLLGTNVADNANIYLNTSSPFCAVTVGVQGAGKSHSLATIIESCALHFPPVSSVSIPLSTLVFHYDTDQANFCEAAMLSCPNRGLASRLAPGEGGVPVSLPAIQKLVVLVSPSFYRQRSKFYHAWENTRVYPLLFTWRTINATMLKSLMQVDVSDSPPLYVGALFDLLRKLQKQDMYPTFESFKNALLQMDFTPAQLAPLALRLQLVESLLAESPENADLTERVELRDVCESGTVVIADLTDPMMTVAEACGVFKVLLDNFRSLELSPQSTGKLIVFDEAHKYLTGGSSASLNELSSTVVELVRQMRHHGMRIMISSQSPMTLPDELLELASLCIVHRFQSWDWFVRLKRKINFSDAAFQHILELPTGNALVFCHRWPYHEDNELGNGVRELRMRQRLTSDGGRSKIVLP